MNVLFTLAQIKKAEEKSIALNSDGSGFDYTNQAWIMDGRYIRCGHITDCNCFGKSHHGEPINLS